MSINYIVNLSDEEREYLYQVTSKGKTTKKNSQKSADTIVSI